MRFTASKPCDLVACIDGNFVAIECKQIKKWKAFGLGDMRPSQLVNLPAVVKSGGKAFVFLNVRIARKENRLIILDWETWGPRLERGSIKARDLQNMTFAYPSTKDDKVFFDLTALYDWINLFN